MCVIGSTALCVCVIGRYCSMCVCVIGIVLLYVCVIGSTALCV